jgi:hypothetical protein
MLTKEELAEMLKEANKSPSLTSIQNLQEKLSDAIEHIRWQEKVIEQAVNLADLRYMPRIKCVHTNWCRAMPEESFPELAQRLKPTSEEVG